MGENAQSKSAALGIVTVLLTLLGWSSVPLFIAYLSHSVDAWSLNGWRYGFSALLWAPILIFGAARRTLPAGLWKAAFIPSIANALGQALFTWAYYNIDTATATFALRMQIVFLATGAYLLFPNERALLRTPQAWIGIALVLCGVCGTIFLGDPSTQTIHTVSGAGHAGLGVAAAILSGLLFAIYALAVRKYMHGLRPVTAFAAVSQITAAISILIMLALARDPVAHQLDLGWSVTRLSADKLAIMAVSAVIGIGLGHTFYFISLARLGVAVTSGVIQLQPFCVALAGYLISGILLTQGQWISGALAVSGAMLLLHTQWRLTRSTAARPQTALQPLAGNEPEGIEAAELDAMPVEAIHHGAVRDVTIRDGADRDGMRRSASGIPGRRPDHS